MGIGLGITTHLGMSKVAIDQNPRSVTEFPGFFDDNTIDRDTKRVREEQGDNKVGKLSKREVISGMEFWSLKIRVIYDVITK